MRNWWMMLGACALAACSRAEQPPARQTADAAPDSAAAPRAEARVATPAVGGTGIRVHPTLPPHAVALQEGEPGVVDSIVVSVDGRPVQTLRPVENVVPVDAGLERLSTIDLDFDGYTDLALLSTIGMANSRSEYWRFDPAARRFVAAGEHETLMPDSAAREHTTYNRGGHAGRLWTAARLRWVDGKLLPVAEEEQTSLDGDRYVHIRRRHHEGKMIEAGRDTLEGEELRAEPSWARP